MFKRLLTLALALMLMVTPLLTAIPASAASNITVYVQTPEDWNFVNLFVWEGDTTLAEWPGISMIYIGDNWWSADIPAGEYTNVIVNDYWVSGEQTIELQMDGSADCWIVLGDHYMTELTYYEDLYNAMVYTDAECTILYDPNTGKPEPNRIYAYVPQDWNDVILWAWNENGESSQGGVPWPGELYMDYIGDGAYYIEIPASYPNMLITNGGAEQSVDISTNLKEDDEVYIDITDPSNPNVYYSMGELVDNCPHNVHDQHGMCQVCGTIVEHQYDYDGYCSCGDYREVTVIIFPGDSGIIMDPNIDEDMLVDPESSNSTFVGEESRIVPSFLILIVLAVVGLVLLLLALAIPVVLVVVIVIVIVSIVKKKKK